MRIQRITTRGEPITLGYRGENNATRVEFDIPDDWQDGVVQLYVLRMNDTDAYVPGGFYVQDGVAYWLVSSADTSVVGRGLAQFCSIKDGVITKTKTFTTITNPSAGNTDITVPEPQKSVLEAALESASEFASEAETAAGNASQAVTEAQGYADDAMQSAQAAANSADRAEAAVYNWFTLSINENTGHLIITENERGD